MKGSFLKEPLVHFLVLGGLLFALYAIVKPAPVTPTENEIRISPGQLEALRARWRTRAGNDPSPEQERAQLDDFIREEVFVREALALGLDTDDVIVRRRLASKFLAVSDRFLRIDEPDDARLQEWMAKRADRFREPDRISFTHVFFSSELRGDQAEADAAALLSEFGRGNPPERAPERGDRFMLNFDYAMKSLRETGELFGDSFAAELARSPEGQWSGSHTSAYGVHLVRVTARKAGYLPSLAEIRGAVLEAYLAEARIAMEEALYQDLRSRYRVVLPDAAER